MDQQPTSPESENNMDMQTLISEWGVAKQYTENYTSDFKSLDNLVDAVPVNHTAGSPWVGDTTLAGLVRQIPRDSLQQLPVFAAKVNGSKFSNKAIIASYILRRGVFNENTFGKGLLSTLQIGAEQALTHGYAPFMTATGKMFDDFGTTMRNLHYADCFPEPGIQDFNESGYYYVTANLTKTRVKKIRDSAMNNPDTSWDVECLNELLNTQPTTQNYSIYQSDPRNKNSSDNAPTYQFVTKYEVGPGGTFTTFSPQYEEKPLRVITNRSKFGYPRIQALVIDPAPLSPFGISRVRLASPSQNLMNAYYQNITNMLLINSDPPIFKRGRFTKPVQLKRRTIWEAQDPNAKAELVTMDNGALEQFVPMAKQMVMQIEAMMGKPNPVRNMGNTSPGVKQQIKVEDNSVNQITHILESFLRQYALVALDTYISEQSGEATILLDDEAKNALNRLTPGMIGDDNKFIITWEDFYAEIEELSVEIELSLGKDDLEEKKRADTQDMLTVMAQTADPNDPVKQAKISELEDRLLEETVPESKRLAPSPPPAPPMAPPEAATPPVANV